MPDAPDISPDTAALMARGIADKVIDERPHQGIEFANVTGVQQGNGLNPLVTLTFPNDPPGVTHVVPCLTGTAPLVGQRVAVIWDPPAGCYVFGTADLLNPPTGRMSLKCGATSA